MRRRLLGGAAYLLVWVLLTLVCGALVFLHGSRQTAGQPRRRARPRTVHGPSGP